LRIDELTLDNWAVSQKGLFQLDFFRCDTGDFCSIGRLYVSKEMGYESYHDGAHFGHDIDEVWLLCPRGWQSKRRIAQRARW